MKGYSRLVYKEIAERYLKGIREVAYTLTGLRYEGIQSPGRGEKEKIIES